jgi:hypothetical protein
MGETLRIFSDKILSRNAGLSVKSNILAVLLQRKDEERFKKLYSHIDLPELVRACEILDASRLKRQYQAKLEKNPNYTKIRSKLPQLTEMINDVDGLSLSLSKIKLVKGWVKSLPAEKLEYRAMMFPTDLWKKLANLTHLNPKNDFSLDWFLEFCFGNPAPESTCVYDYQRLNCDNFFEIYEKHKFNYEIIRTKLDMKSNHASLKDIKTMIIGNEDINTVLWYWEELVDSYNILDIVIKIKNENNLVNLSYSKIVDLISKTENKEVLEELIKVGEMRLIQYQTKVKDSIAIFGDRSPSMDIAIKTSGIITSLLSCLCNADLHLFDSVNEHIVDAPKTIRDAILFGKNIKTRGSTCPAISLMHYVSNKKKVDTMVIITDEQENAACQGYRFARLYEKYINDVHPAQLIFVSFSNPNKDEIMTQELKKVLGDRYDSLVKVFKFNVNNPDLNRMDIVLKCLEK